MPLAGKPNQLVKVIKTEEKGSDVNMAAHLVNDGHRGRYEVAVLITNDSDLHRSGHQTRSDRLRRARLAAGMWTR